MAFCVVHDLPRIQHSQKAMPTLDDVRSHREQILAIARVRGLRAVRVFGSVSRGDATARSDVDFLVEVEAGRSLIDPAGTFRGGFFVDTQLNGNGCLYVTTVHDTTYADYSTGFRCCADAP